MTHRIMTSFSLVFSIGGVCKVSCQICFVTIDGFSYSDKHLETAHHKRMLQHLSFLRTTSGKNQNQAATRTSGDKNLHPAAISPPEVNTSKPHNVNKTNCIIQVNYSRPKDIETNPMITQAGKAYPASKISQPCTSAKPKSSEPYDTLKSSTSLQKNKVASHGLPDTVTVTSLTLTTTYQPHVFPHINMANQSSSQKTTNQGLTSGKARVTLTPPYDFKVPRHQIYCIVCDLHLPESIAFLHCKSDVHIAKLSHKRPWRKSGYFDNPHLEMTQFFCGLCMCVTPSECICGIANKLGKVSPSYHCGLCLYKTTSHRELMADHIPHCDMQNSRILSYLKHIQPECVIMCKGAGESSIGKFQDLDPFCVTVFKF